MTPLRTSILVLTWNSGPSVLEAVDSALSQDAGDVEVAVWDNGSADGGPDLVESRFGDRVAVHRLGENLGYTGGYNRAIAATRGELVLLLNPDARLAPDFVSRAAGAFADPRVGIVAGRLMRPDGETVDSTGQFLARSRKTIDRGYGTRLDRRRDRPGPILAACGAAALYRREMLDDVADDGAVLDAEFFAFNEDLELGWRAWRAGWRAVHVPDAVAWHERAGGRRSGALGLAFRRPPGVTAHIFKNRWLAMIRHDRLRSVLIDLPWIAARDAAWLGAIVLTRPKVLASLWRMRSAFAAARAKRRLDRARSGRWGAWRRDVPTRGVWLEPAAPEPADAAERLS